MTDSLVLNIDAKITAKDLDKTSYEFNRLATKFEKSVGKALSEALQSGLDEKHLAKFEKKAQKIQFDLMAARTNSEREQILAREKGFANEYKHIGQVAKRRLAAMKEVQRGVDDAFEESVKDFSRNLGNAVGDAIDLSLENVGGTIEGIGKKLRGWGAKAQSKEATGIAGVLTRGFGKLLKGLGQVATKIGLSVGLVGLLAAGIAKVAAHGADMNKAVLDGGAAFGDMAQEGKSVSETFKELRNTSSNVENNLKWMKTGKEQMEIIGAFSEAGYTINEMTKGLETAAQKMKAFRKATEAALTYSTLLGMSTTEVAESMAGYMDSLGMSLDGIREQFGAVYDVASKSGYGTKKFFSTVLQATSGMTMYNVRLEDTAGLLLQLSGILGRAGAEQMLGELAGAKGGKGTEDLIREGMMAGQPKMSKINRMESQKNAKILIDLMKDNGISTAQLAEEAQKRGLKVDLSDPDKLASSLGKLTRDQYTEFMSVLQSVPESNGRVMDTFMKAQDIFRADVRGDMKSLASASAGWGEAGNLLQKLNATSGFMSTSLENMTEEQIMGYEKSLGVSRDQFNTLKKIMTNSKATDRNLTLLQKEYKKGRRFSRDEQEEMIEKFGFYISDSGKRVRASNADILKQGGLALEEYEKGNTITDDLMSLQASQLKATVDMSGPKLDQQTQLAMEIAQNTADFGKIMEAGTESILNRIYDMLLDFYNFLTGKDKAEANRAKAMTAVEKQRAEAEKQYRAMQEKIGAAQLKVRETAGKPDSEAAKRAKQELENLETQKAVLKMNLGLMEQAKETIKAADPKVFEQASIGLMDTLTNLPEAMLDPSGLAKRLGVSTEKVFGRMQVPLEEAAKALGPERWATMQEEAEKIAAAREEATGANWSGERMAQEINSELAKMVKEMGQGATLQHMAGGKLGYRKGAVEEGAVRGSEILQMIKKRSLTDVRRAELASTREMFAGGAAEKAAGVAGMVGASDKEAKLLERIISGKGGTLSTGLQQKITPQMLAMFKGMGLDPDTLKKLGGGMTSEDMSELVNLNQEQLQAQVKAEEDKPAEERFLTQLLAKKQPEEWAAVLKKENDRLQREELVGQLAGVGVENPEEIAAALMRGPTSLTGLMKDALRPVRGELEGKLKGTAATSLASFEDFVWRPGQAPIRISDKDVLTGTKAGGPVARAGGGGGNKVINHFYNDSKGFMANQAKMKRAMTGYA